MDTISEILKYTVPALIVLLTTWLVSRLYLKQIRDQQKHELRLKYNTKTLPNRLQAYERLALFLERITVDSLLVREQSAEMSARQFHQHLLAVIRKEYEHNLSQQVYVSDNVWSVVKNAKEGVIKMINTAAMQIEPDAHALELSKKIIDLQMDVATSPTQAALEFIRKEIRQVFGWI